MAPPDPIADALRAVLEPIVRAAVADALADLEPAPRPALLDRAALARELGVCSRTVQRLEGEGLPRVTVGDAPRYRLEAVIAWLERRSTEAA